MPKALFVDISNFELRHILQPICTFVARLVENGGKVIIVTETRAAAEKIDSMLWEFEENSFVPHCVIEEATGLDPVVITPYLSLDFTAPYLVNLTRDVPTYTENFSTIVEFVYRKDRGRLERSRKKWSKYEELGIEREYKKNWR